MHVLIDKGWTMSGMDEDRLKLGLNKTHSRLSRTNMEPKNKNRTPRVLGTYSAY